MYMRGIAGNRRVTQISAFKPKHTNDDQKC